MNKTEEIQAIKEKSKTIERDGVTYYNIYEIARRYNVSLTTINKKLRVTKIKGHRLKSRFLWYTITETERIIKAGNYTKYNGAASTRLDAIVKRLQTIKEAAEAIQTDNVHVDSKIALVIGRIETAIEDTEDAAKFTRETIEL